MTTSADILDAVAAALTPDEGGVAPTSAGARVRRPGDLPTQQDQYPELQVRMVSENRASLGRATPQYTTTAVIRVQGKVSAPASLEDPNVSDVEAQLWQLKREVDVAIVNSYPLFSIVQQLASTQAQMAFDAQATHLAGVQIDFAFEFYEGPEDFAAIAAEPLDELVASPAEENFGGFSLLSLSLQQ